MNTENEEKLYEFIVNYEERIYANEERREDALVQQASHMQTAFSVLSTVILMVAAIVIDHRGKLSLEYLLATFSVICSTLLSSLFCATKAQKRYSRKSFQRADGFHVDALNERGLLETRIQQYDYIARTYAVLHPSLRDVNEKRVRWIVRSMTLFQIALAMCALAFVISIILLLS